MLRWGMAVQLTTQPQQLDLREESRCWGPAYLLVVAAFFKKITSWDASPDLRLFTQFVRWGACLGNPGGETGVAGLLRAYERRFICS